MGHGLHLARAGAHRVVDGQESALKRSNPREGKGRRSNRQRIACRGIESPDYDLAPECTIADQAREPITERASAQEAGLGTPDERDLGHLVANVAFANAEGGILSSKRARSVADMRANLSAGS